MHKPHANWNADHACCFSRVLNILEVVWCPLFKLNQVVWVSSKKQEQIPRTMHKRQRCRIHVIEVGYCMETAYTSKFAEKHAQHKQLMDCLRQAGYADVQLHLLIFGSTGGMFHLTKFHLKQLGIAENPLRLLMEKLHFRALKRLEQLVATRRRLEHSSNEPDKPDNRKRKKDRMTMVGLGVLNGMLGPTHPIYLCKLRLQLRRSGVLRDSPWRANQCGILPQTRLAQPSVEYFILFYFSRS